MTSSERDSGHPQREPQCLLDTSHNFPDLLWTGPCKENAGGHLAPWRPQTPQHRAVLVLAAGGWLPRRFMNCHITLFDPPRVSSVPKSLLHIIALFQIIARENAEFRTDPGREAPLPARRRFLGCAQEGSEWRQCLFLLSQSHERGGKRE